MSSPVNPAQRRRRRRPATLDDCAELGDPLPSESAHLNDGSAPLNNVVSTLYDHPEYYDVAFSWDVTPEIRALEKLLQYHVPFPVASVLETACGTGRLLVGLARRGYRVVGYDANLNMAAYALRRIAQSGLRGRAFVAVGDMRSVRFRRPFDAALSAINSLGYLLPDADVLTHFRRTGESLRPGGIYVVHLACAWDRLPRDDGGTWTLQRDGVGVRTTWVVRAENRERKLSRQVCRMEVDDHGTRLLIEEEHLQRLWFIEDLAGLARASGVLRLAATYTEKGDRIGPGVRVTGEMGNLLHVLERV